MSSLNQKGITTIEVLLCFVLVVIMTVSMYSAISSFNEKRMLEGYKEQIYTYKNLVTKDIQDDFIKIGLTHATYNKTNAGATTIHTLDCDLKDGTKRRLVIKQTIAISATHMGGSTEVDDDFLISYGSDSDMIDYPLPNLGSYKNDYNHTVQNLSINNVIIKIDDENVLSIQIGFHHPDLSTRYGIYIVCPINYVHSTDAKNLLEGSLDPTDPTPVPTPSDEPSCTITLLGAKKTINGVSWFTGDVTGIVNPNNGTIVELKDPNGNNCANPINCVLTNDISAKRFVAKVRSASGAEATCESRLVYRDTTSPKIALSLVNKDVTTTQACTDARSSDSDFPCLAGNTWYKLHANSVNADLDYDTKLSSNPSLGRAIKGKTIWSVNVIDTSNVSESVNVAKTSGGFGSGVKSVQWNYNGTSTFEKIPSDYYQKKTITANNNLSSSDKWYIYHEITQSGKRTLKYKACDNLDNCSEYKIIVTVSDS